MEYDQLFYEDIKLIDMSKYSFYTYFEKNNMLNILEKYPEQAAYIGNVMDSKAVAIMNASGPGALEKVQIQQNQILIQQNEEIIELLKRLK